MTKKSINVIGIMIDAEYKDFKMYQMHESWRRSTQDGADTESGVASSSWVEGFRDILKYLSIPSPANTQFVVVYDVSSPNKEDHIKKLLAGINKNKKYDLLPTLISIGHEQSPWSEEITERVSSIKEVANTDSHKDLLKTIIENTLYNTKKELLAADKADELNQNTKIKLPQSEETPYSSTMNISMMVLGGFIAAAGIAAVAIAFAVLNAATFGVAGLVVAGIGAAAALLGVGLFATGAIKNNYTISNISLEHSNNIVPI